MISLIRGRAGGWIIASALLTHVLIFLNWQWGGLRFTSARGNVLTLAVGMLLPALVYPWIAARLLTPTRSRARLCLIFALAPLALASLLFPVGMLSACSTEIQKDRDSDLHLVRIVKVDGPPVCVYHINSELHPSFYGDTVIQQERPLLPGLIWVTVLHTERLAYVVTVTVLDGHHIRCTFPPCYGQTGTRETVLRTR